MRSRVIVLVIAIAVVSVVLGAVTDGTYQSAAVEHDIQTELEAVSTDPPFTELQFREIGVDYEPYDLHPNSQPSVTVLVERPPGEQEPDDFAEQVHDQL